MAGTGVVERAEALASSAAQRAALSGCEWAVSAEGVSVHAPMPDDGRYAAMVVVELKLLAYDEAGRQVVLRAQHPVALHVPYDALFPAPGEEPAPLAAATW